MRATGGPRSPIVDRFVKYAGENANFRRQLFVVPDSNSDLCSACFGSDSFPSVGIRLA
jgi:hypothetical protein